MNNFYNSDADFREYVNRYAKAYKLTIEEALHHAIVREVAIHYHNIKEGKT